MNNRINKYIRKKQNTIGEKTYNNNSRIKPTLDIMKSMSSKRNRDNAEGYSRSKNV